MNLGSNSWIASLNSLNESITCHSKKICFYLYSTITSENHLQNKFRYWTKTSICTLNLQRDKGEMTWLHVNYAKSVIDLHKSLGKVIISW